MLGNALRTARKAAKLSQQDLASRAGITTGTVCRLERGASDPLGTVRRLARALNLPVTSLIELELEGPAVKPRRKPRKRRRVAELRLEPAAELEGQAVKLEPELEAPSAAQ